MALELAGGFFRGILLGSKRKQTRQNQRDTKFLFLQLQKAFFCWVQSDNLGLGALIINRWVKELPGPAKPRWGQAVGQEQDRN